MDQITPRVWLKDEVLLRAVFLKKVSTGEPISCTSWSVCTCPRPRFGWEFVRFTAKWDVLEDPPPAISELIDRKALDRR